MVPSSHQYVSANMIAGAEVRGRRALLPVEHELRLGARRVRGARGHRRDCGRALGAHQRAVVHSGRGAGLRLRLRLPLTARRADALRYAYVTLRCAVLCCAASRTSPLSAQSSAVQSQSQSQFQSQGSHVM